MSDERSYRVDVQGGAWVKGTVTVKAASKEEAKKKAMDEVMEGGIVWEYDEYMESVDPQITDVKEG